MILFPTISQPFSDAIVGFTETSYAISEGNPEFEICVFLELSPNSTLALEDLEVTPLEVPLIPVSGTAEGEDIGRWEEVASITHLPLLCSL